MLVTVAGFVSTTVDPGPRVVHDAQWGIAVGTVASANTQNHLDHVGLPQSQIEIIEWGVALYDDAGLTLPSIRFTTSADVEDCYGRPGMAIHDKGIPEVRLCGNHSRAVNEWVLLHELAHVWDRHALIDERRRAFLELRGLETWREADWHDRGAEHLAEVMVWALIDRPVRIIRVAPNSCPDLLAAYETLTGQPPLHGYTDHCDP